MRMAAIIASLIVLQGCAAVPLTTGIALAGAVVGAGGLALTGIHNCKEDGGCKSLPLPP